MFGSGPTARFAIRPTSYIYIFFVLFSIYLTSHKKNYICLVIKKKEKKNVLILAFLDVREKQFPRSANASNQTNNEWFQVARFLRVHESRDIVILFANGHGKWLVRPHDVATQNVTKPPVPIGKRV